MRTVSALNEAGFTDITMYETLLRPQQVDVQPVPPSVVGIAEQLKKAEARREEKRLRQIVQAQQQRSAKRKREDADGADGADDGGEKGEKRARTEEVEESAVVDTPLAGTPAPAAVVAEGKPAEERKISVSKAFPEVRGHTSYLTFAVLLPPAAYAAAQEAREASDAPVKMESAQVSSTATPQAVSAA